MMRSAGLVLVLATVLACGSSSTESNATPASASPAASEPIATGTTLELPRKGPAPTVHPGDRLVLDLSDASMGMSDEYRFSWGEASVHGTAVRLVKHETRMPPDDVDGGRPRQHFEFVAIELGDAKISVPTQNVGAEADVEDFEITVRVTAP